MAATTTLSIHSVFGFNYLLLADKQLTDSDISTINNLDYDPKWDSVDGDPFVILANFDETLQSSRKGDIGEILTRWSVYRKLKDDDNYVLVGTINNSEFSIVDPMAGNNQEYVYYIYPETENLIGTAMITDLVKNDSRWSYTLANLIERSDGVFISNEIWNLRLDVESSDVKQNLDITTFKTIGQFDKISRGVKNFLSTTLTCILGDINKQTGLYDLPIEKLNQWRDFIAGSDKYIYKDRKGDVRIVSLVEDPSATCIDETSEQAQKITIGIQETMRVSDLKHGVVGNYSTSEDKTYTHVQTLSSERWVVTHALNKFPKVTVVDASGKQVYAQVTHINKQMVDIRFSKPISGSAYFN